MQFFFKHIIYLDIKQCNYIVEFKSCIHHTGNDESFQLFTIISPMCNNIFQTEKLFMQFALQHLSVNIFSCNSQNFILDGDFHVMNGHSLSFNTAQLITVYARHSFLYFFLKLHANIDVYTRFSNIILAAKLNSPCWMIFSLFHLLNPWVIPLEKSHIYLCFFHDVHEIFNVGKALDLVLWHAPSKAQCIEELFNIMINENHIIFGHPEREFSCDSESWRLCSSWNIDVHQWDSQQKKYIILVTRLSRVHNKNKIKTIS